MPRTICEDCHKEKIVYRIWFNDPQIYSGEKNYKIPYGKSKLQIGERCAAKYLKRGEVFNLRRIQSKDLGTERPQEDFEE